MRLIPAVFLTALLGIVYWVGATIFTDRIQQDITDRSTAAIADVNPDVNLDVDGRDVTLSGLVNSEDDSSAAEQTVDSVWGVRASKNLLEVRDGYDFQATHSPDAGFTMSGKVDTDQALQQMHQSIDPVVPKGSVAAVARPMINSGEKLALGAGTVLMLTDGKLKIDEQQFLVSGTAEDDQIKAAIEQRLANKRADIDPLQLVVDIDVANSMTLACRTQLEEIVDQDTVLFAVDSAVVSTDYEPTISAFAQLLDVCPGLLVIEAHADQDGSENYNLELSQRRATAVAEYIAAVRGSNDRIQYFSYGETRPVASNETTHDKTFNRRVDIEYVHEISLQQPIISSQSAE